MSPDEADRYLARIAADRSTPLGALQELHLRHVPFENLDIHLGVPIDLDPDALFDKVVTRRRGGFCYELNGLFALLLESLGFIVDRLSARVYGSDGTPGPPLDHLALRVVDPGDGAEYLVDVGFGRFTTHPLRWSERVDNDDQVDPAGRFRLVDTPDGFVDVVTNGTATLRIDPRPVTLADAVPMCWWQQTSPASHFTQSTICSRLDGDGRITLTGATLIRSAPTGRTETTLHSDAAVLAAYHDHFGLDLDRVPVAVPARR